MATSDETKVTIESMMAVKASARRVTLMLNGSDAGSAAPSTLGRAAAGVAIAAGTSTQFQMSTVVSQPIMAPSSCERTSNSNARLAANAHINAATVGRWL